MAIINKKFVILVTLSLLMILGALATRIKSSNKDMVRIQTIGLETAGIRLEAPYGPKSMFHVLVVNDSPNHILACEIEFEFTQDNGRVSTAHKRVAFGDLLEADAATRQRLLKKTPGIAPHSRMLLGLGREPDLYRVIDALPPIGESLVEAEENAPLEVQELTITLKAVVLDNGQILGPSATTFMERLKEALSEEPKQ